MKIKMHVWLLSGLLSLGFKVALGDALDPKAQAQIADYKAGKTAFFPESQLAVTGNCEEDLTGDFGFSQIPPSSLPYAIIKELGIISTQASFKRPFFRLHKPLFGQWERIGLNTGSKSQITVEYPNGRDGDEFFSQLMGDYQSQPSRSFEGRKMIICRANLGNNVFLYRIDGQQLNLAEMSGLQEYLERIQWFPKPTQKDLKRMHYLYTYSYSEMGIGGMIFMFPLIKLKQ